MHHFRTVLRRVDNLLWALLPGVCILCDSRSGATADLCDHCRSALPRLPSPCPRCALPLSVKGETASNTEASCDACRSHAPPYTRTVAALRYAEPVTRMVHRLKFRGSRIDARVLGGLLASTVESAYSDRPMPDVVVPVPLSRRRLLRRGHNQAVLLAQWLEMPFEPMVCERIRDTPPQAGLSRTLRLRNLTDAFATGSRFDDRCVAVVDDVMTTGTTVASLARMLLAAGAKEVHVWTAARTLPPTSKFALE
jgi:ComF family protein